MKGKQSRNTKTGKLLSELRASNSELHYIVAMISCSCAANSSKLEFAGSNPDNFLLYQFVNQHEEGLIPGLILHLANQPKLQVKNKREMDSISTNTQSVFDFFFQTYLPAKEKKPLLN